MLFVNNYRALAKRSVAFMRIAIVEDNQTEMERLCSHFDRYQREYQQKFELVWFDNGLKFLEAFNQNFDVIYLDVQMPLMDGMTLATKIREIDRTIPLIFVTNYVQYAIDGYKVDASDFLLKPVKYFNFCEHFKRIEDRFKRQEDAIAITSSEGIVKILLDELYYVESNAHIILYHVFSNGAEKVLETSDTMKNVEQKLADYNFYRCNNSFIVNLKHVAGISGNDVLIADTKLPISRPRKKAFMNALTEYMGMGDK